MAEFVPDRGDRNGIESLLRQIDAADLDAAERVQIRCFSKSEAYWIRNRLLGRRPGMAGRIELSWLEFPR